MRALAAATALEGGVYKKLGITKALRRAFRSNTKINGNYAAGVPLAMIRRGARGGGGISMCVTGLRRCCIYRGIYKQNGTARFLQQNPYPAVTRRTGCIPLRLHFIIETT